MSPRAHKQVHPHDNLGIGARPSLGITMREHYAGLIMAASLPHYSQTEDAARAAVEAADALIAQLDKR